MPAPGPAILELRDAAFRLGERLVFRNANWTLRRGERWLVVGPTGAGKTVFCRALRGELPCVAGALAYRFAAGPRREPAAAIEYLSA